MPLWLLASSQRHRVNPEPLSPSTFSPFGTVITHALPAAHSTIPRCIPLPLHAPYQPAPLLANQSTALKYSPISPLVNDYPDAPSGGAGKPLMSMFSCFPRTLGHDGILEVTILERHPFTTQTFTPLGLSKSHPDTCFLVIVAPSLSDPLLATSQSGVDVQIQRPPDLCNLKAFLAHGGQAITYAVGTWHAPMVVLGKERVDFVVTQFVSGFPDEDCEEASIESGIFVQLDTTAARPMRPKL